MQDTQVWSLGWEETLEKGMVTHSSILAWKIPWTEEPGTLQSMGSQRVRHTWATEQQYSIVLVHHILPIYSSIHGHLGGFHVLAVVSNALVSMLAGHRWHWGLYCLSQSPEQSCTLPVVTLLPCPLSSSIDGVILLQSRGLRSFCRYCRMCLLLRDANALHAALFSFNNSFGEMKTFILRTSSTQFIG